MDNAEAEKILGLRLPVELRSLYERTDGVFNDRGELWVIWHLDRLVADNRTNWNRRRLPSSLLAFGDDGAGNPFCVPLNGTDEVVR
jgi:cell wall assembly regulator SMI1